MTTMSYIPNLSSGQQNATMYKTSTPQSASPSIVVLDDEDTIMTEKAPSVSASENGDALGESPGRLPEDVYDGMLVWWRAAIRKALVRNVEWESEVIAAMQERIRTPWLDKYFVYTSSLGTHTFFMTALPAAYFFGYPEFARGLISILAVGVYCSSFIKDLCCSPRPFAPPVTRLTMGSHHLEYGFPSTHSTNSVSIALYVFSYLYSAFLSSSISTTSFVLWCLGLLFYAFSIVFGRLYTAMHSFTDCAMGVALGVGIWVLYVICGKWWEEWMVGSGWSVPIITITLTLIAVNQHPQPIDDCPCFEDAIAFASALMGAVLGRWHSVQAGYDETTYYTKLMPGSKYETLADVSVWWLYASIKMVVGVLIIFTWRIVAKSALHMILPPTFRLLAQIFTLPNRRFYTPATDYVSVPAEKGLRPIPSVIDLPAHMEMEMQGEVATGTRAGKRKGLYLGAELNRDMKLRGRKEVNGKGEKGGKIADNSNVSGPIEGVWVVEEKIKHYDADVLTKVIVYCGICIMVCEPILLMFEVLGWGVKSRL